PEWGPADRERGRAGPWPLQPGQAGEQVEQVADQDDHDRLGARQAEDHDREAAVDDELDVPDGPGPHPEQAARPAPTAGQRDVLDAAVLYVGEGRLDPLRQRGGRAAVRSRSA